MDIEENSTIKIGARVVCDDFYGTIRYIGSVPPTDGLWLGIEWDDATRGKHNGSYDGQQYFTTSHPTAGSFMRTKKVDLGIGFLEAVHERYKHKKTVPNLQAEKELCIVMKNNAILPVEAVGYEKIGAKQSRLERLLEISVSRMKVSHPGSLGEIKETVPNIRELDLSVSLLCSWEDVAKIAIQLRHLEILNLSENMLEIPSDPSLLNSSFAALKVIVLSKVCYDWQQVLMCTRMWPHVREMRVPYNYITIINIPNDCLNNLEYLDLELNALADWSEVVKLGNLPKLKILNLNGTGLSCISFSDVLPNMKTNLFPVLQCIMLQNNKLAQWSDINELNKLPVLKELAFMNNPLSCLESPNTLRQLLIAKLGNLTTLNRTMILSDERRGAELDYLKKQGNEWLSVSKESVAEDLRMVAFLKEHPRYLQLIDKHGAPEEAEMKQLSRTLMGNLLSVELICTNHLDGKPLIKKLPGSLSINKLRCIIQRLFRINVHGLSMHCISKKNPQVKVLMDNDMRQLSFYAEDGDQILVDF